MSPRLERRQVAEAIGQAGAPLVHDDHACERREPFDQSAELGMRPSGCEAEEKWDEREVDRTVAHDLVRDRDIATLGVLDVTQLHEASLPLDSRHGYDRDDTEAVRRR